VRMTLFEDYKEVDGDHCPEPGDHPDPGSGRRTRFSSEISWTKGSESGSWSQGHPVLLQQPNMFKSQLRAILRASAFGHIQVMFPMISGLQELLDFQEDPQRSDG